MGLESTAEESGLFACRSCGHRVAVDIDTGAEAFVDPESRQSPLRSLGLVRCPACGRRDLRVVLVEALIPAGAGLMIALALAIGLVLVLAIAFAGPDPQQNDARFPFLLAGSVVMGLMGGGGFLAWQLGRAFRRAARNVTFGQAAPPGEALPARGGPTFVLSDEQRSNIAIGLVTTSALAIALLGLGSSLPGMIGVGAAAALVAGVVRGKDTRERAVFSAAFVVAEAGIIVATSLYTQGRSSVWNFELLLPLALGAVPGVAVYLLATKLLPRSRPRG